MMLFMVGWRAYTYMKPFHVTEIAMTHQTLTSTNSGSTAPDGSCRVADAARTLGLKPVRAWVADEKKRGSPGAERVRRCREKAKESGLKQISVTLPTELHPVLKTLAARTKAGESAAAVLTALLSELESPASTASAGARPTAERPGFLRACRRWISRWLHRLNGVQVP